MIPRLPNAPVADPAATVTGDRYRITVLTDGLLRLEYAADGVFEDRASTFALNRALPVPRFRVLDHGTHLEVVTDRLRLTYDKGPFSASGLAVDALGGVSDWQSSWRYGQETEDLRGTARTLDLADGAVPLEPGVVSRHGIAVIDDSASFLFDDDGWAVPRPAGERTDLYLFVHGRDHLAALRALYAVSGPTPLLPRWALGNWWSRFHRYTTASYQELMDRFRAEGIPFSVAVIDMDWHLTDVDPRYGSGWTGYTWNRDLFPDPPAFLSWLHDNGQRVTLNVHPADGIRAFEEAYPAVAAALGRDTAHGDPIAFDATDPDFLRAYLDLHRTLEADGVDFWWVDWQQGTHSRVVGIDPLWVLNHVHYLDSCRDSRPGLTFSRYAGPGSHRYPVGFSGDAVITWDSLDFQPYFTATASNIGYGWWSHDVGGHFRGVRDDELATRWVQLGVFSPITRLHSGNNPFATKEPWSFGPQARATMTAFLRLRHRLVPYLHAMNHRAAAGVPLVLPLYYEWPEAEAAYEVPNQFRFGTELLVAPITRPADRRTLLGRTRGWLPPGTWVDLLTDVVYDGDREVLFHRDLTTVPVLAKAGAIVPLDAGDLGNDPVAPAHVELLLVVGADGSFDLVEGDGPGTAVTALRYDQESGTLRIGPVTGEPRHAPERRAWTVTVVAGDVADPVVTVAGERVEPDARRTATRLSLTVPDVAAHQEVVVSFGPGSLAANDVARLVFELLDRAQIEYDLKWRIHDVVRAEGAVARRAAQVQALGLEPALADAVLELVLARPDAG